MATLALWCHQLTCPDRETKCYSWRGHTPRPRNNSNDFKKTSPITPDTERGDIQIYSLVLRVWGCASNTGWQVVTVWHYHWSLTLGDQPPDTQARPGHHHHHADCRLHLSETFPCYETITKPEVWGMLHKTFICLSFNDWLLTEFPLFCAFLKTSHKLLSADSQYNGCVCTNSNWG